MSGGGSDGDELDLLEEVEFCCHDMTSFECFLRLDDPEWSVESHTEHNLDWHSLQYQSAKLRSVHDGFWQINSGGAGLIGFLSWKSNRGFS